MTTKLLKKACILAFDDESQRIEVLHNSSILIIGDEIAEIGQNIQQPADAEVIDVSGKIITPGFINTHSHMWQTAHRTLGPGITLSEYFFFFSQMSPIIKSYSAEDVYISSLVGYYEGLNAGVTGYIDHAHNNWEMDVIKRGWDAAVDAGARVWWCPNIEDRDGCSEADQLEFMRTLGDRSTDNHPLVSIGLAYDKFTASSPEHVQKTKDDVRSVSISSIDRYSSKSGLTDSPETFTSKLLLYIISADHGQARPMTVFLRLYADTVTVGNASPSRAAEANLQEPNVPVVFSHGGFVTESDRSALSEHNWNLSITPESEMHYGHGQQTSRFIQDQASLGIDTNWTFSGDILFQSRLWLQKVRDASYNHTLDKSLIPEVNPMPVNQLPSFLRYTQIAYAHLRMPLRYSMYLHCSRYR